MRALAGILLVTASAGCKPEEEDDGTFTHVFESHHDTTTDPTGPNPTDTDPTNPTDTDPTGTGDLYGEPPPVALAAPTFTEVASRYGNLASRDDLIGQPTVLWFYPAAFTGG